MKIPTGFSIPAKKLDIVRKKIQNKEKISSYMNRLIDKDLEQDGIVPETIIKDYKYILKNNDKRAYVLKRRMKHINKVRNFLLRNIIFLNIESDDELFSFKMREAKFWLEEQREIAKILKCSTQEIDEIKLYIKLTNEKDKAAMMTEVFNRKGIGPTMYWAVNKFGKDRLLKSMENPYTY